MYFQNSKRQIYSNDLNKVAVKKVWFSDLFTENIIVEKVLPSFHFAKISFSNPIYNIKFKKYEISFSKSIDEVFQTNEHKKEKDDKKA